MSNELHLTQSDLPFTMKFFFFFFQIPFTLNTSSSFASQNGVNGLLERNEFLAPVPDMSDI